MHHPSRLNYYIFILSLILVQSPAPANSFVRKEHRYGRLSPSINAKTKLSTFITNESFDQHGPPVVVGSAVGTEAIPQHHRMPTKFSTFISNERFNQHGPPVVGSGVGTEAIQQDHRMPTRASSRFGGIFHFDRQKFAKLGIAFALTYNIISNICGSVTFSIAWFMASKRVRTSWLKALFLPKNVADHPMLLFSFSSFSATSRRDYHLWLQASGDHWWLPMEASTCLSL